MTDETKNELRRRLIESIDSLIEAHTSKGSREVDTVLGYTRGVVRGRISTLRLLSVVTPDEVEYTDRLIDAAIQGNRLPPLPTSLTKEKA